MAEGKESFILYRDLIHTVRLLTDEQKGKLFLIILEYVNDLNPVVNDPFLMLAFEPIKQQLKRDLKKYESKKELFSMAGMESGKSRKLTNKPQLYVIKMYDKDEEFIKVGITDYSINRRFSSGGEGGGKIGYKYDIISQVFASDITIDLIDLENKIIKKFNEYKYEPERQFKGHTECYDISILNDIERYITTFNDVEHRSTNSTVNVNVNDNVNDNVSVNVISKEFYLDQKEKNNSKPLFEKYSTLIDFLFGTNELNRPIESWLKLRDQLTYDQFVKIYEKSQAKNRKIRDMILSGDNDRKYLKGKVSFYSTLNSWLNRK